MEIFDFLVAAYFEQLEQLPNLLRKYLKDV